jgi:hypothetical protein
MKKSLLLFGLIIVLSTFVAFAQEQSCIVDEDCTEPICTGTHKTYDVTCVEGICVKENTYACIVGNCGAVCDTDDDCLCPASGCVGRDLYTYPSNGDCGTSGSNGCQCLVNTSLGQPCQPVILYNEASCIAEYCQPIEIERICTAEGQAQVSYTYRDDGCGSDFQVFESDAGCACIYSEWETDICIDAGLAAQMRYDLSDYLYCDDLYREYPDDGCSCNKIIEQTICISPGYANQTYSWDQYYCGQGLFYQVTEDQSCACSYSEWQNTTCLDETTRQQERTLVSPYSYCEEPLMQVITDFSCACSCDISFSTCVDNGIADFNWEYNHEYCPQDFVVQGADPDCICEYGEAQDGDCIEDGIREQFSYQTSEFEYCAQVLPLTRSDDACLCLDIESGRQCDSDGQAEVFYDRNFAYCGEPYSQMEADAPCSCVFSDWADEGCVSSGVMEESRYEISQFAYCQDSQTRDVSDPLCDCVLSETGSVCISDGQADVTYSWNHDYCGEPETVTEARAECSCVYDQWKDDSCTSDGIMRQSKIEISLFDYCEDVLYQEVEDPTCGCEASELRRYCNSDGDAAVIYTWNFDYCGVPYTLIELDAACSCQYSDWVDDGCVADGIMFQGREQTTSFEYCEQIQTQEIADPVCGCAAYESGRTCASDGTADVDYSWNYEFCGAVYEKAEQDEDCACLYEPYADDSCVSDGVMKQAADTTSIFAYCPDTLYRDVQDSVCSCVSEESGRICESDGFADVYYAWNYGYCPESYMQSEQDANCGCAYTDWTTVGCVGFRQRGFSRLETSGLEYCQDPLYKVESDLNCDQIGDNGVIGGIGISPTNFCPILVQEERSSVTYFVDTGADGQTTVLENALLGGYAGRSYAFEGETVTFQTTVLDRDGIVQDCVHVYVTIDNGVDPIEAGCVLNSVSDWTDASTGKSYDDALGQFTCIYTVEPAESGTYGEYWISVVAIDGCGEGCQTRAAGVISLFLNPVVSLTIESQDQFGFMYSSSGQKLSEVYPGSTVYSPYFRIENTADPKSGLYMLLKLYATDMYDYDSSAALCPTSNVLTADHIEYKASHLNVQQPWTIMPRDHGNMDYVFSDGNFAGNFLGVGDDLTMRLRLNIPSPCVGNFNDGGQLVFVGEVI